MAIEKNRSALLAIFPTPESYAHFAAKSQNNKTLRSICKFAYNNDLIEVDDINLLENYIQNNSLGESECHPPANMNFETFFDQREMLLELKLSTRALTYRINQFISKHRIELPKVSNSMLTRLKKEAADTPHKQNVLRSLAFWIGYTRGDSALRWNFETLRSLCREGKPSQDHKEGVRIGFSLFSRGEVIDQETMGWLKKNIKNYIECAVNRFSYGRWGKIRSHDITTFYVDFPKEASISSPGAYRQCLRSALSLSHQVCLRWALSDHHTQNRFLSIGIAIGQYSQLDKHLYPIMTARLPADPVIRLTDYCRQCLLINDLRVLTCARPMETTLYNGETLSIWWVEGFWTTLYFDFIPDLLTDKIITNTIAYTQNLTKKLWSQSGKENTSVRLNEKNAISTYFKFPQNALLGIEIAKTLYYRLRFWEALEIIRIVLSLNPTNIIARTLRMVLLSNLALYAPSHAMSQDLFNKAHNEALFIQDNCFFHAEDFYCAHAGVYLTQAMLNLKYLRDGNGCIEKKISIETIKPQIFADLEKADQLFGMGETVSSSGVRSYYLQISSRVISAALKSNPKIFTDSNTPIDGDPKVIRKVTQEFQWQTGYSQKNFSFESAEDLKAKISRSDYLIRKDSIALFAYKPSFYFGSAVALWDFLPDRTVGNALKAIELIQKALKIAENLNSNNICIYSFARTYGEMITPFEFIRQMNNSIDMIKAHAGENLDQRNLNEIIRPKNPGKMDLLSTVNF